MRDHRADQVDAATRERIERAVLEPVANDLMKSIAVVVANEGGLVFSGCFVRAHGRPFLVTAAHCAQAVEDWRAVFIHSAEMPVTSRAARIQGRFWATSPDDFADPDKLTRFDLAVIPLDVSYASDLRPTWFELDELDSTNVAPDARVMLIGFPTDLSETEAAHDGGLRVGLQPMFYVGLVTSPPSAALELDPKENVEFFVDYDPDDLMRFAGAEMVQRVHPRGMSGCGVFVISHVERGKLWSPKRRRLAGIQSSFLPGSRLLRVKRAEHVARLIENACRAMDDHARRRRS